MMAAPRVVVSIGPVHSLVAGVMEGVAEPQLLIPAGASPHAYALKPSDARALSEAELVVWIGEGLETMLEKPLHSLAGEARLLELLQVEGMHLLPSRKGGVWHEQEQGHQAAHAGHGHEHDGVDTHLWLAPENAQRIVAAVADALSAMDAANAQHYQRNAATLRQRIGTLAVTLAQRLEPLQGQPYIVFHDAYHYFEQAFGLQPAGAIAVSPEQRPGVRRLLEIRQAIRDSGARCVFSEPQFRSDIVEVVLEDTGARYGVLDPLGVTLTPGRGQWFALMQGLADSLEACLTAGR
ncbi:MAG: zinc ABC transporter substrate-binding protein [Gammaproteobacteria bacterium]|nr:zinc ABC transporter substrate-binding protein [Gammaproteobacteria bacterium]